MTSNMYYNRSCRACGTHLEPTSICSICEEYVSWICSKCFKIDDVTHRHNYYTIPYMVEVGIVTSYKQEKTKNKMDMYSFLQNNTETEIFRQTLIHRYFAVIQIVNPTSGSHFRVPKMGFVTMLI
jgi:hypothetical protein